MSSTSYECVIGLEVHVELATHSKLFCGCANRFGGSPNSQVCPVCMGLPGVLPVVNQRAIELHILAALALECNVPRLSKFDRKNYFYPDMPKNFQTSQYDLPLAVNGRVVLPGQSDGAVATMARTIGIHRIHLEEDTGKSVHYRTINGKVVPDRLASSEFSLVDYNRAGVPLLEIVSEPEIRSAQEASDYLESLRDILIWLGISDCRMEEGSMRCDANVSIRPVGTIPLGTKAEIKNMNSLKSVRAAIDFEIQRQTEVLNQGGRVIQETRGWDEARGITISMRSKEEAHDYRYFPEPDLPPLELDAAWIERLRRSLPELPRQRQARYVDTMGLSQYDASLVVANRAVSEFFDEVCAAGAEPKEVANWLGNEVARLLLEKNLELAQTQLRPLALAQLLQQVRSGAINHKGARQVLAQLIESGGEPAAVIAQLGLAQISDSGQLAELIRGVLQRNPVAVAEVKAGKEKARNVLVGQVMKETKGRANPGEVNRLLEEALQTGTGE